MCTSSFLCAHSVEDLDGSLVEGYRRNVASASLASGVNYAGQHCSLHKRQKGGGPGIQWRALNGTGEAEMSDQGWEDRQEGQAGNLRRLDFKNLPTFPVTLTRARGLHGKIMAEIHDQFDTILILDFGSQVRS